MLATARSWSCARRSTTSFTPTRSRPSHMTTPIQTTWVSRQGIAWMRMTFSNSTTAAQLQPQPGGRRRCLRERSLLPAPPHRALARPDPRPFSTRHTTGPPPRRWRQPCPYISTGIIFAHREAAPLSGGVDGLACQAVARARRSATPQRREPPSGARWVVRDMRIGPAQRLPWPGRARLTPACV